MKVYRDCRDSLLDRQPDLIPIPVNLKDPRVAYLVPQPKPTHLPTEEGVGDSDDWETYHPEDWESCHIEAFEEWEPLSHPGISSAVGFGPLSLASWFCFWELTNNFPPIGSIRLPISFSSATQRATVTTPFLIIDYPTAYNVILGRPALAQMKVFISTHMLLLKFPTPHGTATVRGDQLGARSCYASAVKFANRQHKGMAFTVTKAPTPPRVGTERPEDPREESVTQQAEPVEDHELVCLHDDIPDRQVRISTSLSQELCSDLVAFFRLNSEIFAWSYNDMPGISPDIISHRLSINPAVRLVQQKCEAYDPERYEAMKAEVEKLSSIGFIKEVDYPTWLANVVMVHKPRKRWPMCVDYTNLNRACLKDSFPLPRIDQCVDATSGHVLLSFMNAYSRGMPFGLEKARATYQRLVNSLFALLIGNTMEVYVDDMLVKSRTADQHISNLSAMFTILKQYKMRLNPTKCAFWVASGKFLGFMISQRGIEANPKKIQAILDMKVPKMVKDIHSLTGRIVALTRFISKATDRCAPFFKALKGSKRNITWTTEYHLYFNSFLFLFQTFNSLIYELFK
ncbi:hypothetical protein L3X38_017696 [Prunus dulcis]|uniref:Reverse transcriptase domain-containing protein n=1 Tax=Prunus dulcis TaxID=3755 RepID=A0AAD4ZA11_PRUDU|nr:hypothetical protein L3X38_017696 [Prunus dulcis]